MLTFGKLKTQAPKPPTCEKQLVSFIIPNRGGSHIADVVYNINSVYADQPHEIIIVTQIDSEPFKKGQLYNIGSRYAKGQYYVLADNDIISLHPLHIAYQYRKIKKPYLAFTDITQGKMCGHRFICVSTDRRLAGYGAFAVVSAETFKKVNGFSNLCMDWGLEDTIFNLKIGGFCRLNQNLGHITHPKRIKKDNHFKVNTKVYNKYKISEIDPLLDGEKQTTAAIISDKIDGNGTRYINASDISVCADYVYTDILQMHNE